MTDKLLHSSSDMHAAISTTTTTINRPALSPTSTSSTLCSQGDPSIENPTAAPSLHLEVSTQVHQRHHSNPLSMISPARLFFHSARSKAPAPIEIPEKPRRNTSESNAASTPPDHPHTMARPLDSPLDGLQSPSELNRRNLHHHESHAHPRRHGHPDDYRRYSGTVNHCGRHANDWLFGGFSVRDTVRDGVEKLRHRKES